MAKDKDIMGRDAGFEDLNAAGLRQIRFPYGRIPREIVDLVGPCDDEVDSPLAPPRDSR